VREASQGADKGPSLLCQPLHKMPRTKTYRELTEVEYMTKYMYYGWKSNLEIKLAIHHPSSTKTCHNLRLAPRKV